MVTNSRPSLDDIREWVVVFVVDTCDKQVQFARTFEGSYDEVVHNCHDLLGGPPVSVHARLGCPWHGRETFFNSERISFLYLAEAEEFNEIHHDEEDEG